MAYSLKLPKGQDKISQVYTVKNKPHEIKVTKEKVYTFENLPPESKEKALENYYDINVNYSGWSDDDFLLDIGIDKKIYENSKIAKEGNTVFNWKNLYFDLDREDYIQFDGLEVKDKETFRKQLGVSKKTWDKVSYSFDNTGRNNNTQIEFSNNYEAELTPSEEGELQDAKEKFSDLVHKAKKQLKADYEYRTSNESIKETFDANEYRFTKDGKLA